MTQALAVGVTADVAIVKGQTPAGDRIELLFPDGAVRRAAAHVVADLPRLVVESAFGLDRGLWGTLAGAGSGGTVKPRTTPRTPSRRNGSIRLVSAPALLSRPAERACPDHAVAKAAADAVVNRWGIGPGTPSGVRDRMRAHSPASAALADALDDETIRAAVAGARRLYRQWRALPPGAALRLTWPLPLAG